MQLLDAAKSFLDGKIKADDTLVDFTAGNGHDTAYLCSLVPKGKVYAFDISILSIDTSCCNQIRSMFLVIIPHPVESICLSVFIDWIHIVRVICSW